ncbi:MAG: hypothetical protein Pars2KO_31900 [Parasphingorhabdus sp.]
MIKISSVAVATLALSIVATPVLAEKAAAIPASAVEVERKDRLFDANGASVAKVSRVENDGDILVIYKGKVRRIQSDTLSMKEGKLMTSMTRSEIRKIR